MIPGGMGGMGMWGTQRDAGGMRGTQTMRGKWEATRYKRRLRGGGGGDEGEDCNISSEDAAVAPTCTADELPSREESPCYVYPELRCHGLFCEPAGASPAMVNAVEEAEDFTKISSALSVNVGTALTPHWIKAMELAASTAHRGSIPWVLDPVGCGATAHRNEQCAKLMQLRPTVVRGNASEIMALAKICQVEVDGGSSAGGGKGVDSTAGSEEALPAGVALAKHFKCVIAISGAVDIITDGNTTVLIRNGQEILTKITAAGCSLSALWSAGRWVR
eukprot:768511-Hanusia_phi.AAC.6